MGKFGKLLLAGTALTGLAGAAAAEGTIAYFAATSQNGFNQATYEGVQEVAAARGYDTEILDGQFDAAVQYSQIEDALASGSVRSANELLRQTTGGYRRCVRAGDRRRHPDRIRLVPDRPGPELARPAGRRGSPSPPPRRRCPAPPAQAGAVVE